MKYKPRQSTSHLVVSFGLVGPPKEIDLFPTSPWIQPNRDSDAEMNKTFWLSFDIGIDGDYAKLYAFLDSVNARECGGKLCTFKMDMKDRKKDPADVVLAAIRKSKMKLRRRDRLYLIWKHENSVLGRFLNGKRESAPWVGYAQSKATKTPEADDASD